MFSRENTSRASGSSEERAFDPAKPREIEDAAARPEPIETALIPARRHAAAAVKLLHDLPMNGEYKDQVRAAVQGLDEQVTRLKKTVGS